MAGGPAAPAAEVVWSSACLDLAPDVHAAGTAYWSAVTGYAVSPTRGAGGELTTLVPPVGDDHLRVQRLGPGPSRVHVDLHVVEVAVAEAEAVRLGGSVLARQSEGQVVVSSPAGITTCLVRHPASRRAAAASWGRHCSVVDQVCLDVAAHAVDVETAWWSALTGWKVQATSSATEFRPLLRPPGQPLRLMVQQVGDDRHPATAHLDLATDDRTAEVARHVRLGGLVISTARHFTVLRDPCGLAYCVTDRDPGTGLL